MVEEVHDLKCPDAGKFLMVRTVGNCKIDIIKVGKLAGICLGFIQHFAMLKDGLFPVYRDIIFAVFRSMPSPPVYRESNSDIVIR